MRSHANRRPPPAQRRGHGFTQTLRAGEWWEFKLAPLFAVVYATAYLLELPLASLWPLFILALAALVPGAAYVSVLNDLTDLEEDLASGKANRLVGRSRAFVAGLLLCCILPGLAVALYWRKDTLLLALYLAAWAAFTLYSVRPIRLKSRGLAGLLADAAGAHLFPTLLVVVLVFRWGGASLDPLWLAAVGVWSLGLGLRGNLWHQITDVSNDERVGLRTFASRHKITSLRRLGNFFIFPAELTALAALLARLQSPAALLFLLLYLLLEWSRRRMWKTGLVVVVPRERSSILMLEYYEVFFPLALLIASTARNPADALVAAAHLLIFPRRAAQCLKDCVKLARQSIAKALGRARRRAA